MKNFGMYGLLLSVESSFTKVENIEVERISTGPYTGKPVPSSVP